MVGLFAVLKSRKINFLLFAFPTVAPESDSSIFYELERLSGDEMLSGQLDDTCCQRKSD